MSRIFPALCILIIIIPLTAATVFTSEPAPLPAAPATTPRAPSDSNAELPDRTVDHLLKAAEHLEAAGLHEEATKIRHDARERAVQESILSRKESELECLQEEVDRLRALTGQGPTLLIEIVVCEVDRRKLGLKAREFDRMIGFPGAAPGGSPDEPAPQSGGDHADPKTGGSAGIAEVNPARLPLFRELREAGTVKVLAEPTIVTTSRRPASFLSGGEIPVRVRSSSGDISIRNVPFGTQLDVVAVVLPNQRVRLQTALELRDVRKGDVVDDDGTAHPGIDSRRLNTEIEMQFGQSLTIGRLLVQRPVGAEEKGAQRSGKKTAANPPGKSPADSVETIVFITPRLAQLATLPRPANVLRIGAGDDPLQPVVPAGFDPADWDALGPPVPVLKRRTLRD